MPHDPFQVVAFLFPIHGRGRNVCAEGRHLSHEVFAGVHEVAQLLQRQSVGTRVLVHEMPGLTTLFSKRRVKECPSHPLTARTAQEASVEVAKLMLDVISGGEIRT